MKTLIAVVVLLCAVTPARGQWFPWASGGAKPTAPTQAASAERMRVHPAVARIVAPGRGSVSYGSGTLVKVEGQYGLVITNWHVVNEATGPVSVIFPDGFHSVGTVQKADRDWDLAAIAIMRPNVEPVSLATTAPQQGELLTIAGYGSGNYRAASGPCTQYVAPGVSFPLEMVELAATARQGDSGGPILNGRGELAGVLFGEGGGRTAGSYCGRVRWFLDSVAPAPPALHYGGTPAAVVAQRKPSTPTAAATAEWRPARPEANAPLERFAASPPHVQNVVPASQARASRGPAVTRLASGEPGSAPAASIAIGKSSTQSIGWKDVAGDSWPEQFKSVLAAIGGLAVILKTLRLVSRE